MEVAISRINECRRVPSISGDNAREGRPVNASKVVNSLNRINFQDGHVFVQLRHVRNNSSIIVAAKPAPGDGAETRLLWDETAGLISEGLFPYEYCGFYYTDGLKMVWVKAELISLDSRGILLAAPEEGNEVCGRNVQRHRCFEIPTKINQGNVSLQGSLKDYSGAAFTVIFSLDKVAGIRKINFDMPVNILLENGEDLLFKDTCRIVRSSDQDEGTVLVLVPVSTNSRIIQPKKFRSVRLQLLPQPYVEFDHPFLGKRISLKAEDISGSGVSVTEDSANYLLMPGMVIPEMTITFANSFKIYCRAQVLYVRPVGDGELFQAGLAFTNMSCEDQLQLASILCQAKNERSYIGAGLDQDELWDFFFETGFIYPKKYLSIEAQKEKLRSLYGRLYSGCPDISRHITYRDKGNIYGHVSMFRYYRETWLLHHHAAIRSSQHKAGLVVMDHILQHINEVNHLADAAMKYIACYFRPNNRFANRVFGGASRSLQDPAKSSLDEFAYFHFSNRTERDMPSDWILARSSCDELGTLSSFYNEISGGLMLKALDLEKKDGLDERGINGCYRAHGLKRNRDFYSLKTKEGCLAALFILNFSDVGLNMSSLTNCIQVIVIDQNSVGYNILESVLSVLSKNFEGDAPVLLFPKSYADDKDLVYENVYTLGILDLNYINKFLGFMEGLTKSKLQLAGEKNNGKKE